MDKNLACPRCLTDIPEDRLYQKPIICPRCGHSDQRMTRQAQKKLTQHLMTFYFVFTLLLGASALHFLHENQPLQSDSRLQRIEQLAHSQKNRGQDSLAMENYSKYFSSGGQSLEAALHYAELMGRNGQIEGAIIYYEALLKSGSEAIQIPATRPYVRLLIKNGDLLKAQSLIQEIRQQGSSAHLFMQAEWEQIQRSLPVMARR